MYNQRSRYYHELRREFLLEARVEIHFHLLAEETPSRLSVSGCRQCLHHMLSDRPPVMTSVDWAQTWADDSFAFRGLQSFWPQVVSLLFVFAGAPQTYLWITLCLVISCSEITFELVFFFRKCEPFCSSFWLVVSHGRTTRRSSDFRLKLRETEKRLVCLCRFYFLGPYLHWPFVWWFFCWVVLFQGQCRPQVHTIWNALDFTTSTTVRLRSRTYYKRTLVSKAQTPPLMSWTSRKHAE